MFSHGNLRPIEIINESNKLFLKHNSILYPLIQESETQLSTFDLHVYDIINLLFETDDNGGINALTLEIMGEEITYKKQ